MVQKQALLDLPKCYLEIDDPRITQATDCYVDFFFHAQTLTVIVTQPEGSIVETIRIPIVVPETILILQEEVRKWHTRNNYLRLFPTVGRGKKRFRHTNDTAIKPKIKPPWVTNPDKFGSWRPSLLKYRDYHLIEVMIDGEKSFVHWRNLCQMCELSAVESLLDGFSLVRQDGSDRWLDFHKTLPKDSERTIISAFSRINPPGVNPPEDLVYARPHNFDIHLCHGKANALESEYSVNRRAFAFRKSRGDLDLPLDDHGFPLVKGSINGLEVYVGKESYWKECYLTVSVDDILTVGLQRTDGRVEKLHVSITNDQVLGAFKKMVDAWRELWPDQVPGFVCDLSSDWSAEPAINSQDHWFNPSYGFEDTWIVNEKVDRKLPDGGTETEADISVREVSNGFSLRLVFGDGSQKVIHFHTADLMHGRRETGDLINVWNTLQGETIGNWSTFREERAWSLNSIAKTSLVFFSKLFTG